MQPKSESVLTIGSAFDLYGYLGPKFDIIANWQKKMLIKNIMMISHYNEHTQCVSG